MPDIGINLPIEILQLVKTVDGFVGVQNCDGFCDREAAWIQETDAIRAVAEDERLPIVGETPPFTVVLKLADFGEGLSVVNETDAVLPGKLKDFAVEQR